MRIAVAGAGVLVVVAGGAFYYVSSHRQAPAREGAVRVVIQADRCEPNALTVPAGRATFEIVNASDRVVEWEILDGVMVVEERENIAPGLSSQLSARLSPGTYAITCGLLTNPRGTLTVTPSAGSESEAARPAATAFLGALAEYQAYLALESADFAASAQDLADAVKAGDLDGARTAYEAARTSYLHVAPAAQRFSDLDTALNAQADYFAGREKDPNFTGFHRLALGLYGPQGLNGLQPVADKFAADGAQLSTRMRTLKLTPDALANGAASSLSRAADLAGAPAKDGAALEKADFAAEIAGAAKVVSLLDPLVRKASPQLASDTDAALKAASADAAGLAAPGNDSASRAALAKDLRALAEDLSKFNGALGLD
ncbi:iron uptake system component EfeO [Pseudoxanthobacter soli DSM 19599]|uniref:Iron uptake system component EfeO n=1 Tax=Pseudoxanthobacter soli DSM 19599 TaxID=1123029 RepID=A0A1M7ZLE2_9HYPH|nr:iron uptake system protein EfeO [Pseudoxanthobacter soli]SHO65642.1 iron uptake system component EfeO [Pseudoxanthobacter soli DSM 19599]